MDKKKVLVMGLGNTILSDDGVGIRIAHQIKKHLPDVDVIEASAAGFRVIDEIVGYEKLIIIDSIITGKAEPGSLLRFKLDDFNHTLHFSSPHDIGLFDAIKIMEQQDEKMPAEIDIYAIEVEDTATFSEKCTARVESAIPELTQKIIAEQFD